jgi:hypothetical protein
MTRRVISAEPCRAASVDRGGLDGMLALNGIFILMTQHSLEYPQFYNRQGVVE